MGSLDEAALGRARREGRPLPADAEGTQAQEEVVEPGADHAAAKALTHQPTVGLRRAHPDDAQAITELVLRSKRQWGYPDKLMALMAPALHFMRADLESSDDHIEVLEVDGRLAGVVRLQRRTELAFLDDLWVDPPFIGRGYGRLLFERAATVARGWGKGVMELHADPFAEAFYRHLGASRVGMWPSTLVPGRSIPIMRFSL